jgi:hypothetical protein
VKLVIAVIRTEKLNDALAALFRADVRGQSSRLGEQSYPPTDRLPGDHPSQQAVRLRIVRIGGG